MSEKETQISIEKNQITIAIEELLNSLNQETVHGLVCISAIDFNPTGKVVRVELIYF
jgi:hypothetical protein